MSRSRGVVSGARRAASIMRIIEDVMVRRARGEQVTDAEVAAANPELMPDLGKELALLSMLERARHTASRVSGSSGAGRGLDGPIQPLGEGAFEGFRVVREVHRGGQGVVFEAVQASTGRRVAIKMMREGLFAGDRDAGRFEREVRILGQLEHPGIVGIIASGVRGGHFYYVMDYVDGLPLDEYLVGRSTRAMLEVIEKVADALNAAHLKGIIHRDLKPGNILVCSDGSPKVLDFGLARIAAEGEQRVTMTGQFVGSMPWSSPEQAAGDQAKVDVRTDVYSMGVIMYQAFTGRFPYAVDGTPRDVLNNILTASPSRLRSGDSGVDAGIDAIVRKCLSKERERRYQSAGELAADIRRHLAGQPVLAHPPDAWYQAKMFARRNRALVIGGVAVLAALFLGLIGTTTGLLEASASKRVAMLERDAAKKSEAIAKSERAVAEASAYAASIAAADAALRVNDGANAKTHLRAAPVALRGWEWKYLASQADRSEETLKLPPVIAARTTSDGNHLLALERAGALSLTDLRDGRLVWRVNVPKALGQRREQAIIGVSGDGRLAATQHDGTVAVWNMTQGAIETTLVQRGTTWGLMTASFSPDGSRLVTCGRQGMMCVWSLSENRIIAEQAVNTSFCSGADYSPDGALLAVSVYGGVKVLDGETLELVRLLKAPGTRYPDWGFVRFTPDGKRVIANFGNSLASLDVLDQSPPVVFRGGVQDFMRFNLSGDGQHLVAGSWDRTVREWNVRTGVLELTLTGHELQVNEASFGLDDTRVYSTDDDGVVKCWRPREQFEPGVLALYGAMQVSVIGAGDRAVFHGKDRVRMVDIEREREISANLPADALGVSISPDGERMVYAIGISGEQSLWDVKAGKRLWTATAPAEYIHQSRFSPDGSMIVTTANDGTLCVWDAAKGELLRSFKDASSPPAMIRFHPKKPEMVVGGAWRQLEVWDTNTWVRRIVAVPADTAHTFVNAVAYSPDGSLLAAGDGDGQLTIWDTSTWTMVRALPTLRAVVWKLEFSPDGTRLAAACHDRMIHLFQTSDWRETLLLRGHTGVVTSLDWTPDGRRLLSSAVDGTIRIWDSGRIKWDIGAGEAGKKEQPASAGH